MPEQAKPTEAGSGRESDARTTRSLNLTTGGLTLLGVILGIGLTVAFGISGAWWVRLAVGALTIAGLILLVKTASSSGRGLLARTANWVIGAPRDGG